jgi:hypothetical protein
MIEKVEMTRRKTFGKSNGKAQTDAENRRRRQKIRNDK